MESNLKNDSCLKMNAADKISFSPSMAISHTLSHFESIVWEHFMRILILEDNADRRTAMLEHIADCLPMTSRVFVSQFGSSLSHVYRRHQRFAINYVRWETLVKNSTHFGFSRFWDLYLPVGISSIPASCFKLMRLAAAGLDQPGAGIATWQIVVMLVLQTIGIVGIAVVVLVRVEMGMAQLAAASPHNPTRWRRRCLFVSMGCLALFDIFFNVGVFAGASPLIAVAFLWYLLYVLGIRLTFSKLQKSA